MSCSAICCAPAWWSLKASPSASIAWCGKPSKDTGKQVKLDITGGSIEIDRGVLDRMAPAFEHMLRNCVAHGIEDCRGARRQRASQPPATITISLHQEGNDISVSSSDDGAGLNLARIREKAPGKACCSDKRCCRMPMPPT